MNKPFLILTLAVSAAIGLAQNSAGYKFSAKIKLPGEGKWDYTSVDNNRSRLYVSHGDRVHVIDLNANKAIAEWTGLENVHGITFSALENKVYISNTGLNNVVIYNANTLEKITTVELPGGKKPDCILFDEYSQKVFVFCGKSNNVFVIDAKTDQLLTTIALGGQPEFACTDEKGLIYNNLEDKNEVVVIDSKNNQLIKRFSLLENKAPTGIAIDKVNGRIFVACEESRKMAVLSASTGKVISTAPMGEKTDGLIYEQEMHLVVTSNGAGSATVIRQETPDSYTVIQTLKTQPGLKTISCERKTHRIFMTGADLQADGKTIVAGSFGVYIYDLN